VPSHFVPLAAPGIVWQGLRWMLDPGSPFYIKPRASWDLVSWGLRFVRSATAGHVQRSAPALLALNRASRELFDTLAADLGREVLSYSDRGLLMLCRTEAALEHEAKLVATARDFGLDVRVVDRAELTRLEPGVEIDALGAVYYGDDAHLDPGAVMQRLQARLAADAGVTLRFGTDAVGVRHQGGRVSGVEVQAVGGPGAREVIAADAVVLAAGSWSAALGRALGLRLLLQPGKGYSVTVAAPQPALRCAAILVEARASATTYGERFRIGGTMELAGFAGGASATRIEGIKRAAQTYFPSLTRSALDQGTLWSGLRPVSPDGLPYLGAVPGLANAFVATGHAMMGFSAGPITGRLIAELVTGEAPSLDISAFRPDRHGRWWA